MFDECRKIEIHKIQNHYHYYVLNGKQIPVQLVDNCRYHPLKPKPHLRHNEWERQDSISTSRKGLKLTKAIKQLETKSEFINSPIYLLEKFESAASQNNNIEARQLSQHQQQNVLDRNKALLFSLYGNTHQTKYQTSSFEIERSKQDNLCHIQKLDAKSKINSILTTQQAEFHQKSHCFSKKTTNLQQTSQVLGSTKPAQSKIQTCCTVEMFTSGRLTQQNKNDDLRQSLNSKKEKSQLISISKSASSIQSSCPQSSMKSKIKLGQHIQEDRHKSSNQISLIFSNIFSRQSNNQSSQKKFQTRENILKRLSLWQDSDRHTISSRLSRQYDFTQDYSIKVEESFIEDYDIHKNFTILEQNKIAKKDYVVSQAVQKSLNMVVSLKEFISKDAKLIVQQLEAYQLIQNLQHNPFPPAIINNVLALYKVQLKDSIQFLIKEPFTMPLQNIIKNLDAIQLRKLRQTLKQISSHLLQLFQTHSFYPIRKITTHEFVYCVNELKFHDLTIFQFAKKPFLQPEIALAGLQI